MDAPAPRAPRVSANAAALLLAYVLPRAFTFAAGIAAARVLGPAGYGAYGTAAAIAVVASILATLGMQPLLVRGIARDPGAAPALIGAAHAAKLLTILAMAAALLLTAPALGLDAGVAAAALLLGGAYGIGAVVENLSAYFQGVERMHVWTQASALYGLVAGVLGVILVVATRDLLWFCVAPIAGQLTALAWLLRRAPAAVRRPPRPRAADVAALFRSLAPFAAAFVATTIYYRADILILAHWRSASEVGLYTAARRFLDIAQAVALAGAGALYPRLARQGPGPARATRNALELALLAGVPAAALLTLLRAPIIHTLYGAGYGASVPVLAVLAPALAPLAINMFGLSALTAAGDAGAAARLCIGAAALNVLLNLALVPGLGAAGAAAASLGSETALAAAFLLTLAARGAAPSGAAVRATVRAGALAFVFAAAAPWLRLAAAPAYALTVVAVYWQAGLLWRERKSAAPSAAASEGGTASDAGTPEAA